MWEEGKTNLTSNLFTVITTLNNTKDCFVLCIGSFYPKGFCTLLNMLYFIGACLIVTCGKTSATNGLAVIVLNSFILLAFYDI